MRSVSHVWSPLLLVGGAGLVAYGGYGAGLGCAAGGDLPHWLQVAAAAAVGSGLFGTGLWRSRRGATNAPVSFAGDLTALERLLPTVRRHPDGLDALQELVEIVFEAHHRPAPARKAETVVERMPEGRSNA